MSRFAVLTGSEPTDDLSQLDHAEVRERLITEARRIIRGESKMLPTRAHVAALIQELDERDGLAPTITDPHEDFPVRLPGKPFSSYALDEQQITTDDIGAIVSAIEDDPARFAVTFLELRIDVANQRVHIETLEQRVSNLAAWTQV